MKRFRTQFIEILVTVKRSFITWYSMGLIICMGVTAFLGINFASQSILKTADSFYRQTNFEALTLASGGGLIGEDGLKAIRAVDGVASAEGGYTAEGLLTVGTQVLAVKALSVPTSVSKPVVTEGRLPDGPNECAIDHWLAEEYGVKPGAVLPLDTSSQYGIPQVTGASMTVTGVVYHPYYATVGASSLRGYTSLGNGFADSYILLDRSAYNPLVYAGGYTDAHVSLASGGSGDAFSKEFTARVAKAKSAIQALDAAYDISDRNASPSYYLVTGESDSIKSLALYFSTIFIVISLLVIYSSTARMVQSQRKLIGAQLAFGCPRSMIFGRYLVFGLTATIVGGIFGVLFAYYILSPLASMSVFSSCYLGTMLLAFDLPMTAAVAVVAVVLTIAASLTAVAKLLRQNAVTLMRDEVPKYGGMTLIERIPFLWKRLPLNLATALRSLSEDKTRLITTVISVAGCVMILLISFTLKLSIDGVIPIQYGQIIQFDKKISTDRRLPGAGESIESILKGKSGLTCLRLSEKPSALLTDGGKTACILIVVDGKDAAAFGNYLHTGLDLPEKGVLVSKKASEKYGYGVGSTLRLSGAAEASTVAGVFENYCNHIAVMTREEYKRSFGAEPEMTEFYLKGGVDYGALAGELAKTKGFINLQDAMKEKSTFERTSSSINGVVLLLLVTAVFLSGVILTNFGFILLHKKRNELAVMRVNGFTLRETKRYIRVESIITTFAGLVAGLLAGIPVAGFIVWKVELGAVMFLRAPSLLACALAVGLTILFTVLVNCITLGSIKKLNMGSIGADV